MGNRTVLLIANRPQFFVPGHLIEEKLTFSQIKPTLERLVVVLRKRLREFIVPQQVNMIAACLLR